MFRFGTASGQNVAGARHPAGLLKHTLPGSKAETVRGCVATQPKYRDVAPAAAPYLGYRTGALAPDLWVLQADLCG